MDQRLQSNFWDGGWDGMGGRWGNKDYNCIVDFLMMNFSVVNFK